MSKVNTISPPDGGDKNYAPLFKKSKVSLRVTQQPDHLAPFRFFPGSHAKSTTPYDHNDRP